MWFESSAHFVVNPTNQRVETNSSHASHTNFVWLYLSLVYKSARRGRRSERIGYITPNGSRAGLLERLLSLGSINRGAGSRYALAIAVFQYTINLKIMKLQINQLDGSR